MKFFKLYLLLLLILGINFSIQSQINSRSVESLLLNSNDPASFFMPHSIQKISHKIDHVVRYYDYCGQTRETLLYFDSTGLLLARYLGPWIRNANVPPGPTFSNIYSVLNPAPSFFFTNNDSKSYYYNARTKKAEPLPYSQIQCKSEGFVAAQRMEDHKYAFLNKKAEPICAFIYEEVSSFENGIAIVKREGKEGLINTTGKEIIPCIYQNIKVLYSKEIQAKKGYRSFDYFNKKGNPILFPKTDN